MVTLHTQNPSDTRIDDRLNEAKRLLQSGQINEAMMVFDALLSQNATDCEALYYLAVCQRKCNETEKALNTLQQLENAHPQYGRAFQEQGHNFLFVKETEKAILAFEKAVAFNPALLASWKTLNRLYQDNGQAANSATSTHHIQWLSSLPAALVTVTSLIHENKLFKAEQLCRAFLQQNPHHIEAMRLLAELGMKLQILDDAEFLLESCVEFNPDYQRARLEYVQVFIGIRVIQL